MGMIKNHREVSIGSLFGDKNSFRVPRYQRGYAWEVEQLADFCDDIRSCFDARRRQPPGKRAHFFGAIVCVETDVPGSGRKELEVIDGQQRLASVVLLISVITKHYQSMESAFREANQLQNVELVRERRTALERDYIQFKDEVNREFKSVRKLILSSADDDFFDKMLREVHETPSRASQKRLAAGREQFGKFVQELLKDSDTSQQLDDLKLLTEVLNDDAILILLTTESAGHAYQLFQVLNDRGISLTEGDLLRAKTLELLRSHVEIQREVADFWDEILADDPDLTEKYLRWYYSSAKGQAPKRASLYDEFREHFFSVADEHAVTRAEADNVVGSVRVLRDSVRLMRKLKDGEWPYAASAQPVTQWDRNRLSILITYLNHDRCIPLLLSATRLSEKSFADLVRDVEVFFFRYKVISDQHISPVDRIYFGTARLVREQPSRFSLKDFRRDLQELLDRHATEELFVEQLKVKMQYSSEKSNKPIRYLLVSLEENWRSLKEDGRRGIKDKSRVYDPSATTIDHIYPQNAGPDERDSFLESVKDQLGNLTILGPSDNVDLANKNFNEKRKLLRGTNMGINQDIASLDGWGRTEYKQRTDQILNAATKIFRVE